LFLALYLNCFWYSQLTYCIQKNQISTTLVILVISCSKDYENIIRIIKVIQEKRMIGSFIGAKNLALNQMQF
jgi:hypothetical protein